MVVDMKIKFIGIILMVSVSVIALGCVESPSDPKSIESPQIKIKTIALITASPAEMLPTINDMPDGAKKLGDTGNDTYAEKKFAIITGFTAQTIIYEIRKFSSNNEAIDGYNSIKNKYSDYKLSSVNLGEESFGLVVANSIATVAFRKANVVVKVEFVGQYTANLDDTISYAEMVETPTTTLKLVADRKTLTNGETWNISGGYALRVIAIDYKTTPKQAAVELSRNGNIIDTFILSERISYSNSNLFITNVESISDSGVVISTVMVQNT
jgi:hypothetical protein